MVWTLAIPLLSATWLAVVGAANAQVTPVCFDPGASRLSPEGYIALRTLAIEQGGTNARGHIRLFAASNEPKGLTAERLGEMRLELARNGLFYGRMETVEGNDPVGPNCLGAEVSREIPGYFALWHFYGPFFESGSEAVSPVGRQSLRYILPGYEPGRTLFIIEGHADTQGPIAANMSLSRRRAENVALELVRQGVRWDDLSLRWFGETRLARPTADDVSEPLNRRVTVDVRQRRPDAPR